MRSGGKEEPSQAPPTAADPATADEVSNDNLEKMAREMLALANESDDARTAYLFRVSATILTVLVNTFRKRDAH